MCQQRLTHQESGINDMTNKQTQTHIQSHTDTRVHTHTHTHTHPQSNIHTHTHTQINSLFETIDSIMVLVDFLQSLQKSLARGEHSVGQEECVQAVFYFQQHLLMFLHSINIFRHLSLIIKLVMYNGLNITVLNL